MQRAPDLSKHCFAPGEVLKTITEESGVDPMDGLQFTRVVVHYCEHLAKLPKKDQERHLAALVCAMQNSIADREWEMSYED